MKTKLVLWGTNEKEEKVLLALELRPNDNKVNIFTFPENIATEEFGKQMFDEWRNGKAILFPEGYETMERELSLTEGLLPDNIKVERGDVIQRAQTEWQFVVLSSKLNQVYQSELAELKETIEQLTDYDSKIWENLKTFWAKVQGQVRERNLFRDHANTLRENTNELFSKMKELRNSLNKEFEAMSATHFETFKTRLGEIEEKVSKGMNLSNIFNELKDIQRNFRDTKFTKEHRAKVWAQLDGLFKLVKEKKFGPDANNDNSPSDRLTKRYQGLMSAIGKMENSIKRDRDDLKYQDRKIATTDGQLEAQIRQAKIKMIEERIRSKEEKMADMHRTREELEKRLVAQKEKDARREEQVKIAKAKEEAKAKIKEEIKAAEVAREAQGQKLEKAAEAITGKEKPTESEEILAAVTNTAGQVGEEIQDTLEDAVDTVKAIAEVLGGKISEKMSEVKNQVEDAIEEVKEDIQEVKNTVKADMKEAKEAVKEQVAETKKEVNENVADAKEEVEIDVELEKARTVAAVPSVPIKTPKADDDKPDDLKIIEGIGPKIEEILQNVGIKTYHKLSETSPTQLSSILLAAGNRYKSHNPGTWPKQSRMAADGKWDELKAWQEELDGGIDRKAERRTEEE